MNRSTSIKTSRIWIRMALAATLALGSMALVYLAAGMSLGLFFGGVVVVTLLLPPMVLERQSWTDQAMLASAVNDSVGLIWLFALFTPGLTVVQWLASYVLLASYSFALWGLTRGLRALRLHPILAAAGAVAVGGLWLSWPIWIGRSVSGRAVNWLVEPHPLLSLNGVLKHLGIWSERPIAYNHLLRLGQDVPYALPDSIISGVFVHLIAGGIFFALASLRETRVQST